MISLPQLFSLRLFKLNFSSYLICKSNWFWSKVSSWSLYFCRWTNSFQPWQSKSLTTGRACFGPISLSALNFSFEKMVCLRCPSLNRLGITKFARKMTQRPNFSSCPFLSYPWPCCLLFPFRPVLLWSKSRYWVPPHPIWGSSDICLIRPTQSFWCRTSYWLSSSSTEWWCHGASPRTPTCRPLYNPWMPHSTGLWLSCQRAYSRVFPVLR